MYNRINMPWFMQALVVGLVGVALAGCSGAGQAVNPTDSPDDTQPATSATPVQLVKPVAPTESRPTPERTFAVVETLVPEEKVIEAMKPTPENPFIANLVDQAQQDLAQRLNVASEKIVLVKFEDVVWPDGSLGCPMPGVEYTQVMVEGYRIQLEYGGQTYDYHGGGRRLPFLCESPQK